MVSFDNTEIAFLSKKSSELRKAKYLFILLSNPFIVKVWKVIINLLIKIKLPIDRVYKPAFYRQFVGGGSMEDCEKVIKVLADQNVKSILDYPIERTRSASSQEKAFQEILKSVKFSATHPFVAFSVFKPSVLVEKEILRKVSSGIQLENPNEIQGYELFKTRVEELCRAAYEANKPILIDAELSWNQKAIDNIAEAMMSKFNKDRAIVYNTFQMYRHDRLDFILKAHRRAVELGYVLGAKVVRGAYMEIERSNAEKKGITSPIHETKQDTDRDFNEAVKYSIMNIETISLYCGTHNEDSINYLTCLMDNHGVSINDPRIYFSQLYGMSDNISFNLAESNYNVAKYIPYGPLKKVIPYLIRRAEENTSVQGQSGRELKYIRIELNLDVQEKQRRYNYPNMKFNNEKTVDKLQALKKIYAILVLSVIFILYSTTWEFYTIKYLGLSRLTISITFVIAYLVYYFYHLFSKTSYFSYSDDDYKIIIRYYPLKSVTPKLSSIEIPKNQIYKYTIVKRFLSEGVVIYQKSGKQIAKYPPFSIKGLKKEEKQKLFDSLNQFVQEDNLSKVVS